MKINAGLLPLLFLLACNSGKQKQTAGTMPGTVQSNDLAEAGFKGNIKTTRLYIYSSTFQKFGEWIPDDSSNIHLEITEFDKAGFAVSRYDSMHNPYGNRVKTVNVQKTDSTIKYTITANGSSYIFNDVKHWGDKYSYTTTERDEAGRLVSESKTKLNDSMKLVEQEDISYDSTGKRIAHMTSYSTYYSKDSVRLLKRDMITPNMSDTVYCVIKERDSKGNPVKQLLFVNGAEKPVINIFTYEYYKQ